ncbi:MAG: ATP-binding protein [Fibromonadales bacterium]|nr:ATP-binding protein [Fibromonadales bacterium]
MQKLVHALIETTEIFTSHSKKDFSDVMSSGLKPIADAANLNRIAVYRLLNKEEGRIGQIYLWEHGKTIPLDEILVELPKVSPVIRWLKVLTAGECINGNVLDMDKEQADFCALFKIKSILFVPIFTYNEFWGIVTLEDQKSYRYFEEDQLKLLRSAAQICANAFIRNEMTENANKAIEELKNANEFNQAVLDSMPIGFSAVNDNLQFINCNDTLANLLGTTKQNILSNFNDFFPERQSDGVKSSDAVTDAHNRALKGEKLVFEYTHRSSSGELIPFEVTLSRAKYKERYILLAYQYDLRLRKRLLDSIYAQSKAKDDFLSKMSHEIRTPMSAILGITEIQLRNKNLPAEIRKALNIIYNSGDSLLRIINDLLDLSKIEAKKLDLTPVKYELANLISDSAQLNIARIESKPLEFELDVDENVPAELFGDELRIKQILNNILSNAFKYTNSGKISLSVSAEKNKDSDAILIFNISDTGQGMTEEQIGVLFSTEYSRFNLVSNRLIEGTGLGMAIVKNLLNLMNGEITVKSEVGKGSEFIIRLPQKFFGTKVIGKKTAENLRKFRMNYASQLKKTQVTYNPMPHGSVLIVDDVETNLYVAKYLLEPYDLSIETASSGFEAIEKIESGKVYDIIFMDHMMPKMNGIEAAKIIRKLGYTQPIIALTANAIVGQADNFLENGFDSFISKPIDTGQLDTELKKFISSPVSDLVSALLPIFAKDAKDTLPAIESVFKNIAKATDEDLQLYAIKTHAMKSALANIGENEHAELAAMLEKAGNERNKKIIEQKTQELIDVLKAIIKKIEAETEKKSSEKDEDTALLQEQLKIISNACLNYDTQTANVAIANLKKTPWTKETQAILDKISNSLLLSDFDKARSLCFLFSA